MGTLCHFINIMIVFIFYNFFADSFKIILIISSYLFYFNLKNFKKICNHFEVKLKESFEKSKFKIYKTNDKINLKLKDLVIENKIIKNQSPLDHCISFYKLILNNISIIFNTKKIIKTNERANRIKMSFFLVVNKIKVIKTEIIVSFLVCIRTIHRYEHSIWIIKFYNFLLFYEKDPRCLCLLVKY